MRSTLAIMVAAAALAACNEETPLDVFAEPQFASATATGPAGAATFEVSVTNLTEGQPMTPPLTVTHRQAIDLFEVGEPATEGIKEIAENGNLAPMLAALGASMHVADHVVAAGDPVPPLLPSEERTFEITTERGAKWLSFAAMLICTNDGFTGIHSLRLPRDVGESVAVYTNAYDAGTEINTEDFDDLVPPCGPLTGGMDTGAGTGMSDPALAENGVITAHPGISGGADLEPGLHGWSDPVTHVVITRTQ